MSLELQPAEKIKDYVSIEMPKQFLDRKIYRIEFDGPHGKKCVNYIDDSNKHIVFKNKHGIYKVFHLEDNPNPTTIKKIQKELPKKRNPEKHADLTKDAVLLQYCEPQVNLTHAQSTIDDLNSELHKKCPNLFLKLAPFAEFTEPVIRYNTSGYHCVGCRFYDILILALCKGHSSVECISTIEMIISKEGGILINSKTDSKEEGKKYNKLLRNVLSIVGKDIPNVFYIKSTAMNPISAWLLLKYSNARIQEDDPFAAYMENKSLTKETIAEYYKTGKKETKLIVDLNHENSINAHDEFKKLIAGKFASDEIVCD
jgi:hypothetical protein